ncbi:hypothetical protein HDU83_000072 [Entophlyctis luteolus]|nr:hypothetical protein HDU83_000072 [Entophlyctis luteolus]
MAPTTPTNPLTQRHLARCALAVARAAWRCAETAPDTTDTTDTTVAPKSSTTRGTNNALLALSRSLLRLAPPPPSSRASLAVCPKCRSVFVPGRNCRVRVAPSRHFSKHRNTPIPRCIFFLKLNKQTSPHDSQQPVLPPAIPQKSPSRKEKISPKFRRRQSDILNFVTYHCLLCNAKSIAKGPMVRDRVRALRNQTTLSLPKSKDSSSEVPLQNTTAATRSFGSVETPGVSNQHSVPDTKPKHTPQNLPLGKGPGTSSQKSQKTDRRVDAKKGRDSSSTKLKSLKGLLANSRKKGSEECGKGGFNLDDFLL